ncbi:MAG: zinc ribbon domain-containing protein [Clostridiales bacterium]|nr:MAG: zinc ribbon domain-containing protein [Clostridiales bacterium]
MAFCSKCGAQLSENSNFCPVCGASTKGNESSNNQNISLNVNSDKIMGVLSYIWILVLIPIFAAPNSSFARFHANQGLVLLLFEIGVSVISAILMAIFSWPFFIVFKIIISIFSGLISLGFFALAIYGIVNAVKGEENELPVIGKIRILR